MYYRLGKHGSSYWGKAGAGILYTDGEHVLLLRRGEHSADHKGKWCFPGGACEPDETAIDTARRESLEEVGYFAGHRIGKFERQDGHHVYTTFIFRVSEMFVPMLDGTENDDFAWVPLDQADKLSLIPPLQQSFPHFRNYIKAKISPKFQDWLEWRESCTV